jgi:hypothetical protein
MWGERVKKFVPGQVPKVFHPCMGNLLIFARKGQTLSELTSLVKKPGSFEQTMFTKQIDT